MKQLILSIVFVGAALAADIKSLPNQAGNGDIDIAGNAFVDPKEVQQVVGAPMEAGYIVVRVKVTPRTAQAIRISPDDFTLVSRRDGERSSALTPNQISGAADLIIRRESAGVSVGTNASGTKTSISAAREGPSKGADLGLVKILEAKLLPDMETKETVEGLLYFLMEGKNKPKDLGLLYKGAAGHLAVDFK